MALLAKRSKKLNQVDGKDNLKDNIHTASCGSINNTIHARSCRSTTATKMALWQMMVGGKRKRMLSRRQATLLLMAMQGVDAMMFQLRCNWKMVMMMVKN